MRKAFADVSTPRSGVLRAPETSCFCRLGGSETELGNRLPVDARCQRVINLRLRVALDGELRRTGTGAVTADRSPRNVLLGCWGNIGRLHHWLGRSWDHFGRRRDLGTLPDGPVGVRGD